jgi:nitrate reductase NapE component
MGHTVAERSWKKPTFCVFPVFSVAVMEKCCDACGDGEYYFRSGCSASEGAGVSEASIAVDRKSMGHTVAERSWKKPTFCVFPVFSVAVMEKCCDACGDGEYYFRSGCSASEGAGVSEASIAVDRKSMGHTVAERSWKEADFLCISCI